MQDHSTRPTIHDVARVAHVSTSTASKALRDVPGVSPETRKLVREAARGLNYRVAASGASLRAGGHRVVSVVVNDALALTEESRPEGDYAMQLFSLRFVTELSLQLSADDVDVRLGLPGAGPNSSDASVVVAALDDPTVPDGVGFGTPIIVAGALSSDPRVHACVVMDHVAMTREVLEHLTCQGYRRPALLVPDLPWYHVDAVAHSYRTWCEQRRLPAEVVRFPATDAAALVAPATTAHDRDIDAIYTLGHCATVLQGLQRSGLTPGVDIGLVSRGEGLVEAALEPQVTSVSMRARDCARLVAQLVDEGLRAGYPDRDTAPIVATAPFELTVRATSQPRR